MTEQGWTLVAVALGWLLAEVAQYWRLRRDDRRAFGRALAHILEVQRQIYFLCGLPFDDAYARLPESDRVALNSGIRRAAERMAAGHAGLEGAVDSIAGVNPLLAARLRKWGTYSVADAIGAASTSEASLALLRDLQPAMGAALEQVSELVNHLAWHHGLATWVRLKVRSGKGGESLAHFLPPTVLGGRRRGPTRS